MFEKWYSVIFITLLPPLVPPLQGGKQEKSSSLPFTRGGLGWGKKYLIHQPELFKHPLKEDVVVTLQPGTDSGRVLRQIKYFRRGAAGARPVPLSGSKTMFYENGDFYINLNEILEEEN